MRRQRFPLHASVANCALQYNWNCSRSRASTSTLHMTRRKTVSYRPGNSHYRTSSKHGYTYTFVSNLDLKAVASSRSPDLGGLR